MVIEPVHALQWWIEFFTFNPKQPFLFTSDKFWIFFAMVLAVDALVYKQRAWRHGFLFAVSVFFYYKTSGLFFLLLVFTICADFFISKRMHASRRSSTRKWLLALGLTLDIGLLCYFKYAYFFTDACNSLFHTHNHVFNWFAYWSNGYFGTHFTFSKIILPVGISFHTFQAVSYYIDVYRKELQPVKRLTDFGFFVCFFPQLVAGPIAKASTFIPQLYKDYSLTRQQFGMAVFWILNGLLKKIFLADFIAAQFIDRVFDNPVGYSGFENLSALVGYSLQVYADFSGYTDMAIGIALLMGFELARNFNSPYKAVNLSDFWRRWHISLSNWLKEYLYIPLGGNKAGSVGTFLAVGLIVFFITLLSRSWIVLGISTGVIGVVALLSRMIPAFSSWITTNLNLLITMLVGGLWHGASWNFIIWGGLNGLGLIFSKLWRRISPWEANNRWYGRAWKIFLTFLFITFTRTWFRAGSGTTWTDFEATHHIQAEFLSATSMLNRIFCGMDWTMVPQVISGYSEVFVIILAGFIIHWLPEGWKNKYRTWFAGLPIWMLVLVAFLVVIASYQMMSADLHPFIYFQF